jgi:hypothetical protein
MHQHHPHLILVVALAATLTACPHTPKPGESIEEVCKLENDGKELSVSGYFAPPKMMTFCSDTCTFHITPGRQEEEGKQYLTTAFQVGEGNMTMTKLPDKFTASDIQVTDSNGKTFGTGAAVRMTGKLMVNESAGATSCYMFKPSKFEVQ